MGFKLSERVYAIPPGLLAPDERLVLGAYAFRADDDFDVRPTAWPTLTTVAEMCGWSDRRTNRDEAGHLTDQSGRRRAHDRVAALEAAGWMRKATDRKGSIRAGGRFRPPVWVLNLPEPAEWLDGDEPVLARHQLRPTEKAIDLASRKARFSSSTAQAEPWAHTEPTAQDGQSPPALAEPTDRGRRQGRAVGAGRATNQKGIRREGSEENIIHLNAGPPSDVLEVGVDDEVAALRQEIEAHVASKAIGKGQVNLLARYVASDHGLREPSSYKAVISTWNDPHVLTELCDAVAKWIADQEQRRRHR